MDAAGGNAWRRAQFDPLLIGVSHIAPCYEYAERAEGESLAAKGAVRAKQPVKVLGQGDIAVPVQVTANAFSASAREKIEAAGGSTTVV